MLKKLGNLLVHYNFREANMVTNSLSKTCIKLTTSNKPYILLSPSKVVKDYLASDLSGVLSNKLIL